MRVGSQGIRPTEIDPVKMAGSGGAPAAGPMDLAVGNARVLCGDALERLRELPDESVNCIVTSPPYFGLRDYGMDGQIGKEPTIAEYLSRLVAVFDECRRILKKDGTCWVNMGDSYASACPCGRRNVVGEGSMENGKREARPPRMPDGLKEKDLMGMPWRLAFALQEAGWYLRQDIIWAKPNPMPESVTDRCTKAHEYVFLLTKSARYCFDAEAIADKCVGSPLTTRGNGAKGATGAYRGLVGKGEITDTRNARSVWEIATQACAEAHFATFPKNLPKRCISAGCPPDGVVLDPFAGSGTTLAVALELGRAAIGIELNPEYLGLIRDRLLAVPLSLFAGPAEVGRPHSQPSESGGRP